MTVVTTGSDFIEIAGHAPKAIVCHGISAIVNMVANYVIDNEWGKIIAEDGYLMIYDISGEHRNDSLFAAMLKGLKDIDSEYPGNMEFNEQ